MNGDPRAVLLVGGVGVGKTALAVETYTVLAEAGFAVAALDLDRLAWVSPDPATGATVASILEANLRAVRPAFDRAGIRFHVLARAVADAGDVRAVREAFGVPLDVVRVTCPPSLAEVRIRARDVGAELEENLAERDAFAGCVGEDFAVENGQRPIREVALELLDRLGWTRMVP